MAGALVVAHSVRAFEAPGTLHRESDLRSAWTSVGGLRTHYRAGGTGEPVMLVQGAGVSGRYLAPLADELASARAAYVPDLPGFGLSEHPALHPGLAWLAEALVGFAGAVGLDRPSIVANSFGCQIAVTSGDARRHAVVRARPTLDAGRRTGCRACARRRTFVAER